MFYIVNLNIVIAYSDITASVSYKTTPFQLKFCNLKTRTIKLIILG